jgi:hypothetical protein
MPPSVTDVGTYAVDTDAPIAPLPVELLELVKPPPEPDPLERALMAPEPGRDHSNYVRAAVEGEVQRVLEATNGRRNTTLNLASFNLGTLVGADMLDYDEAQQAMEAAGMAVAPDEPTHVAATVRSGLDAGMRQPRSIE